MKSLHKFFFLIVVSTVLSSSGVIAQTAEQEKMWQDYMSPGEVHAMMAKSAGDWKTVTKYWMDPAGEPTSADGTCKNEMILGGRYMQSKHSANMGGMPFEGIALLGYDNITNEFTSIWIDNMGTGTMIGKGKWDTQNNSVALTGNMVDPMVGKEVPYREVFKIVDDKTQVMELFGNGPDGKEYKMLEVTYTR